MKRFINMILFTLLKISNGFDYYINFIIDNPWRTAFIVLIFFIIIFFKYGANIEKLLAHIAKAFAWTGISVKRFVTTHDLQSRFSLAIEKLKNEHLDLPEEKIKIKWIKSTNRETFLKNKKAIIKLNYDKNVNDNFVRLSIGYIKGSIVPHTRDYMRKTLSDAINYYYTKKLILLEENSETLDHFIAHYLRNRIQENEELLDYFNRIEDIDYSGNFSRIFLKEVKTISQKYYPKKLFDPSISLEIDNLLDYIHGISIKNSDIDVELGHYTNEFNLHIILVAKPSTKNVGYIAYTKRVGIVLRNGCSNIYFLSRGRNNLKFANEVIALSKNKYNLELVFKSTFYVKRDNTKVATMCALLKK